MPIGGLKWISDTPKMPIGGLKWISDTPEMPIGGLKPLYKEREERLWCPPPAVCVGPKRFYTNHISFLFSLRPGTFYYLYVALHKSQTRYKVNEYGERTDEGNQHCHQQNPHNDTENFV